MQIEVRENLPVGHNLQDHPVAGITLFTDVETLLRCIGAIAVGVARTPAIVDLQVVADVPAPFLQHTDKR